MSYFHSISHKSVLDVITLFWSSQHSTAFPQNPLYPTPRPTCHLRLSASELMTTQPPGTAQRQAFTSASLRPVAEDSGRAEGAGAGDSGRG